MTDEKKETEPLRWQVRLQNQVALGLLDLTKLTLALMEETAQLRAYCRAVADAYPQLIREKSL